MRKKNALIIIDPQEDFMDTTNAALPVSGAKADMDRLAAFILKNIDEIDHIAVTMDSHHPVDISHPTGWVDEKGNPIGPFTVITAQDVRDGKYSWTRNPMWAKKYTEALEQQGEFTHFIWPEHCLVATKGHNIYEPLLQAIHAWERKKGGIFGAEYVTKGSNALTEHFGAFQAQVPIPDAPNTQPRIELLTKLQSFENVLLAGQARSHCVATSLKQMLDLVPNLASKLVVLTDCMSDVPSPPGGPDFSQNFPPIADRARKMGARFAKSTDPINSYSQATATV